MIDNFDVIKKLQLENCKNLKGFPLDNVTNCHIGKDGWGRVTIAVDNETVKKILDSELVGHFMVVDKEDFYRVKNSN